MGDVRSDTTQKNKEQLISVSCGAEKSPQRRYPGEQPGEYTPRRVQETWWGRRTAAPRRTHSSGEELMCSRFPSRTSTPVALLITLALGAAAQAQVANNCSNYANGAKGAYCLNGSDTWFDVMTQAIKN